MFKGRREALLNSLLENNKDRIYEIINNMYPIDIAIILEEFDNETLLKFYRLTDDELMSQIVEQANEDLQIRIIKLLDFQAIVHLFSYMSNDDIADILGNLPIKMRKDLLNLMKVGDFKQLQELLGYEEDSAGGIMTTEYIALSGQLTMLEVLKKIKEIGPRTEVIETIFVLNKRKQLIGTADLRDILSAADGEKLFNIMDDNIISVQPEVDQEEVSLLVSKYDLKAIPVVNRKNSLLGIITVDDIIDVIVEEQTEDMLRLGGVSKEERVDSSLLTSVKKRLPWLFINLGTAFLAAFTVGLFEDVIVQVVALAAAMPIVAGMGGNAGTQTLSVVVRSIALGEVELKKNWKLVFKEIALGIINGGATGIITGIILYMKYGNPYLGFIIFAAMIGNLLIAGFFGFLIPLLLKRIGIDPALASAIFLTTATDVFGFFLFLGLAKMFLPYLL
ncbi:magnesium transporter [Sinanaerobacter chloroacetimidivorans]|uniref:Magnesium transporter MgtE n=1 Tax=Sinanaerobacter chloroacetimidivorans TaxID=2818044 RepID=A0A8J7VZ96_9FIRM|nr:magnesium transporter [Sinanaerobacter chloroacetimidivorans]MBR0597887.1 magnesium transporter [Sinanaerobacter chloroacetimidivorans]